MINLKLKMEHLKNIYYFKKLSVNQIKNILSSVSIKDVIKDQIIYNQDDPSDESFYFIISGEIVN